jgi:hypothetical protein
MTRTPFVVPALVGIVGAQFRLKGGTSAPVKAIELSGESPDRGSRYLPVVDGNCVFNRKGGEQPETNEQSVAKVNLIWPSLSGSVLVNCEPLTSRHVPDEAQLRVAVSSAGR